MIRRFQQTLLPVIASILILVGLTAGVSARTGLELPSWGEADSLQAGPLGLNPKQQDTSVPVALTIPDADVDAEVERNQIVDGVMLDPSGPWVVSWYEETGLLGEVDNVVMSGHVDYWDVGPAVFWTVGDLAEGAQMQVRGDDGAVYTYAVEWVRTYEVAGLTPEVINEIVGPTDYRALTLITCGGDFNYETGEYLSRTIIRGKLIDAEGVPVAAEEPETETEDAGESGGELAVGGTAIVTDDGLNLRESASTEADVVTQLSAGQEVNIIGGPEEAGGYTWWQVQLGDGLQGWVAGDFLEP